MTTIQSHGTTFTEDDVLADFAVSDWLKNLIVETRQRDCLDSLRDTELLTRILEQRCIKAGCITTQ